MNVKFILKFAIYEVKTICVWATQGKCFNGINAHFSNKIVFKTILYEYKENMCVG